MDAKATGKDIIVAILDNMRESAEPLLYSTVVACLYDVYLHERDHERLSPVFPKIREQARRALSAEVARYGRRSRLLPGLGKDARYEPVETEFQVRFHKDENDEVHPGDVLVDSRLSLPRQAEYGVGSRTQRTLTLRASGETRKLRAFQEPAGEAPRPLARLAYLDRQGRRQEYRMTAAEIAIGRGGASQYCDLQVDGPADVSRRHLYLRRDEKTREFFVQDVSRFGTVVDGRTVANRQWVRIPDRARIELAGKLAIEFEAL